MFTSGQERKSRFGSGLLHRQLDRALRRSTVIFDSTRSLSKSLKMSVGSVASFAASSELIGEPSGVMILASFSAMLGLLCCTLQSTATAAKYWTHWLTRWDRSFFRWAHRSGRAG